MSSELSLPWKPLPLRLPLFQLSTCLFALLFPWGCLDGTKVKNIPFLLQVLKIILLRSGLDPPIALPSAVPAHMAAPTPQSHQPAWG